MADTDTDAERMRHALELILLLDFDRILDGPPIPHAEVIDGIVYVAEDVRLPPVVVGRLIRNIARDGLGLPRPTEAPHG